MTDSIRKQAVFDTNIFLAAHLTKNPNSPTAELLSRWANDEFDILYGIKIMDGLHFLYEVRGDVKSCN